MPGSERSATSRLSLSAAIHWLLSTFGLNASMAEPPPLVMAISDSSVTSVRSVMSSSEHDANETLTAVSMLMSTVFTRNEFFFIVLFYFYCLYFVFLS